MKRPTLLLCAIVLAGPAIRADRTPDAVVVQVSDEDLNRVLRDAFLAEGGPIFHGFRERASRSIFGMEYTAELSVPQLRLAEGGRAALEFEIRRAEVHIAELQKKLIGREVRCEDLGATLREGRTLDVRLELAFEIDEAGLHVLPREVFAPGVKRAFRLIKPARCTNAPLPKWLLWWLGKPHLRGKLADLDEKLLDGARRGAAELDRDGGLLAIEWPIAGDRFRLAPGSLVTGRGGLRLHFDGEFGKPIESDARFSRFDPRADGSFVALSEAAVNSVLVRTFRDWSERTTRPSGNFRRLLKSDAVYALVPGLRGIGDVGQLSLRLRLEEPPRVSFRRDDSGRATVEIALQGIGLEILSGAPAAEESLGRLRIDSGVVVAAPYVGSLGGVSLDTLTNRWLLSSSGIEFDEPLLAATIQELVFGELFETRYEPLASNGLSIARTRFDVTSFRAQEGYLFVGFGPRTQGERYSSAARTLETSSAAR